MSILNWSWAGLAGAGIAGAGIAAYALYRREAARGGRRIALAGTDAFGGNFSRVREAGASAQHILPGRWDRVDEASDESFPASDPPGTY